MKNKKLTIMTLGVSLLALMLHVVPSVSRNLQATMIGANVTTANLTATGNMAVTGTSTLTGTTTVTGSTTLNGALSANGQVDLGDDGDTVAINSSDWDISATGAMTGIGAITSDGDFLTTGSVTMGATPKLAMGEDGWVASGETWTYGAADDPTYTFTVTGDKTSKYSAGMRVKLTQTTAKYFLITKVAYSDPNTTMTVYGGTDYDLADAAITSPFYSGLKAPVGFPLDPDKWTVKVTDAADRSRQDSATTSTWYNVAGTSIDIPIGLWDVYYTTTLEAADENGGAAAYTLTIESTLSTANNSESDAEFTSLSYIYVNTGRYLIGAFWTHSKNKILNLATKDTYYLNVRTFSNETTTVGFVNDQTTTVVRARCAYL